MNVLYAFGNTKTSPMSLGYYKVVSKYRGQTEVDFTKPNLFIKNECMGLQSYPPSCDQTQMKCDYRFKWLRNGDNIEIELETTIQTGLWTGVGFSNDGSMV